MKRLILASLIGQSLPLTATADPHDVYGLWRSEAGDGHIEITNCGDDTPCGQLVWFDPQTTPTNRDARNRDVSLRERPLIGVPIVWGYERSRSGWRGGYIYNPEDGKTFRSNIRKQSNGGLEVKGCLGPICRTNVWIPLQAGDRE